MNKTKDQASIDSHQRDHSDEQIGFFKFSLDPRFRRHVRCISYADDPQQKSCLIAGRGRLIHVTEEKSKSITNSCSFNGTFKFFIVDGKLSMEQFITNPEFEIVAKGGKNTIL